MIYQIIRREQQRAGLAFQVSFQQVGTIQMSLGSSRVPEEPRLPRGLVHQCLVHTFRMAPERELVLTVRAAPSNVSCPRATVCAPAVAKLFPFPSYAPLSFFTTVPSSSWEAGLSFSLPDASLLQVPLQIF